MISREDVAPRVSRWEPPRQQSQQHRAIREARARAINRWWCARPGWVRETSRHPTQKPEGEGDIRPSRISLSPPTPCHAALNEPNHEPSRGGNRTTLPPFPPPLYLHVDAIRCRNASTAAPVRSQPSNTYRPAPAYAWRASTPSQLCVEPSKGFAVVQHYWVSIGPAGNMSQSLSPKGFTIQLQCFSVRMNDLRRETRRTLKRPGERGGSLSSHCEFEEASPSCSLWVELLLGFAQSRNGRR